MDGNVVDELCCTQLRHRWRYEQSGLEALAFAAEGDMRNALNGAQCGPQHGGCLSRTCGFRTVLIGLAGA